MPAPPAQVSAESQATMPVVECEGDSTPGGESPVALSPRRPMFTDDAGCRLRQKTLLSQSRKDAKKKTVSFPESLVWRFGNEFPRRNNREKSGYPETRSRLTGVSHARSTL